MKIDKDSYGLIAGMWAVSAGLAAVVLLCISVRWVSVPLTVLLAVFMLFVAWFHRVPKRRPQGSERVVTSVADGKVVIIGKVFEKEYLKKECIQVSVYMDFFDVHANFWPVTGTVSYYKYHPGRYLLAFLPKASELNEHASTAVRTSCGEVFFKQIAGTFARRIVCYAQEGLPTTSGEQCGIIKFGSRLDLFLPLDADIRVRVGEKTKACETVIAILP